MVIDTLRQNAETLYFPLQCVDAMQGKALRGAFDSILNNVYNVIQQCVDLVSETLTGQSLPSELPTDWVKSD